MGSKIKLLYVIFNIINNKYNFKNILKNKEGPREKLIENGPDLLSNSELLAIIFNVGTRNENVLELSARCLKEYGARSIVSLKKVDEAQEALKITQLKACQLVALFELGRRFFKEDIGTIPKIRGPEDVFRLFSFMGRLKREEFRALYINSRQRLIHEELISIGGISEVKVFIKNVVQPAVELAITGVIVIHNHPSGELSPSIQDITFTKKLKKAMKLLDLELLDHLIII